MPEWGTLIVVAILSTLFSSLVTYFVTTRNMESIMRRVLKEEMEDHLQAYHSLDVSNFVVKSIREHRQDCGGELKKDIKNMYDKVDSMNREIGETTRSMLSLNTTIKNIARKLNVLEG